LRSAPVRCTTLGAMREVPSDEARLLKLEEKVAYQDKLIAELNEVVVSLHKKHDQLQARFTTIETALRAELGLHDVPNEAPPHY
jgi:uncharacterized coiled-coil protein SlyX